MRAAAGETERQENGGGHAGPGVQSGEHLDVRVILESLTSITLYAGLQFRNIFAPINELTLLANIKNR